MKEIKAYVRVSIANQVVQGLEGAGFGSMTIIDVSALGRLADPTHSKYSMEYIDKYSRMAKIELVCSSEDALRVVDVIRACGCTHQPGDGIIFVSPVERAVKIRTGDEGHEVLQM